MALRRRYLLQTLVLALALVFVTLPVPAPDALPAAAAGDDSGLAGRAQDVREFADPPSDSRPTVLWFWNGAMTQDLIDTQLAAMRREGITEAIIFPRGDDPKLTPKFFSEGWFDIVGHTLREAQRTGMHLWLFNDDYFPSGRAGTFVLRGGQVGDRVYEPRPDLRPQEVTSLGSQQVMGPGPVRLELPQPGGFAVADGRLRVDAPAAGGGGIALLDRGAGWTDYSVDYDLKIHRNAAGLVVRAKDAANGYLIDHGISGVVNIYRQRDGALTRIASGSAAGLDPAAFRHVSVRMSGNQIQVLVNDKVVTTATDSMFTTGTAGLRVVANQLAEFDNLVVRDGSGGVTYSQDFASPAAVDDFDRSAFHPRTDPADVVAVSALPVRDGRPTLDGAIDLTAKFRAGEVWDAPAGSYDVQYFKVGYLTMTGLYDAYLDLMKPEAVERYLDVIYGEYHRRFPWAFGTVLRGFWDDEPANPAEWGRLAWSDGLPAELAEQGRTPAQVLPALFADLGRAGRVAKGAYRHAVADGLANYYELSGRWADQHGVALLSNPYSDHFGPSGAVTWGDTFKNDQWFQVPGADAVFNQVLPGKQTVIPRYPASSAHQLGRERVAAELMGAYGWGVTPELTRFVTGYMAVRGVNLGVLHAYWSDASKVIHPPPFQPENTWYDATDGLTDWMGRVMEAGRGKAAAPTALLFPQRAAEIWRGTATGTGLDSDFESTVAAIEDVQVDFDVLDEASLDGDTAMREQAKPAGGALRLGPQAYRVVVVPPTPTMSLATVQRLQELAHQGGTVVALGRLATEETAGKDAALAAALRELFGVDPANPVDSTRAHGSGRAFFAADEDRLQQLLRSAGAPAAGLTPASEDVRVLRVEHGGQNAFLVMNEGSSVVRTTATFPASGTPTLWDPEDGSVRTAPSFFATRDGRATSVPLRLAPHQLMVVNLDGAGPSTQPHLLGWDGAASSVGLADARTMTGTVELSEPGDHVLLGQAGGRFYRGKVATTDPLRPVPVNGPWRFRLDQPGTTWTERPLGSWTGFHPAYSGSALYETEVELTAGDLAEGRRIRLDLGKAADVAEVTVNGTPAGRLLWQPYDLDVSGHLRPGRNTITVRVTNTNANAKGIVQTSGLLGPVALRPSRVEQVRLALDPTAVADDDVVALAVAPSEVTLAGCRPRTVTATVTNYGPRPVSGDLTVTAPPGVSAKVSDGQVRLGGTEQASVDIDVALDGQDRVDGVLRVGFGGRTATVAVDALDNSNIALDSTVTASSTNSRFSPAAVADGARDSARWDKGDGWNDDTLGQFPDWIRLTLPCAQPVGRVDVHTLDSAQFPASRLGVRDYDVQVLVDGGWQTVDQVRGNTRGSVTSTFPAVVATDVRVLVLASNDGGHSRLMEVEVYGR